MRERETGNKRRRGGGGGIGEWKGKRKEKREKLFDQFSPLLRDAANIFLLLSSSSSFWMVGAFCCCFWYWVCLSLYNYFGRGILVIPRCRWRLPFLLDIPIAIYARYWWPTILRSGGSVAGWRFTIVRTQLNGPNVNRRKGHTATTTLRVLTCPTRAPSSPPRVPPGRSASTRMTRAREEDSCPKCRSTLCNSLTTISSYYNYLVLLCVDEEIAVRWLPAIDFLSLELI